jgi:predicted protein tyrosine phosphatase
VSITARFVPFDLTVCGLAELPGHCEVGVSHVLSILDPGTPKPTAFGTYGEHDRLELRFHDIIEEIAGMIPPQREHVERVLDFGRSLQAEPRPSAHLLVHCYAGISRSTASMVLMLTQARPDRPAEDAMAQVRRIRPQAWPNLRIIEMGDALLGRDGELVTAVRKHYGLVLEQRPDFGGQMIAMGREREVDAALR